MVEENFILQMFSRALLSNTDSAIAGARTSVRQYILIYFIHL